MYGLRDLAWDGNKLLCWRKQTGFNIVPDEKYPGMWRVRSPNGRLSDMVNRPRAKDAALSLALTVLNAPRQIHA